MLSSRTVWTILWAEHAQMRERLAEIAEAAGAVHWHDPQPVTQRIRQLIEAWQTFDAASHRPKGISLFEALRGRSPEADALIATLERERQADDRLLDDALALIDAAGSGRPGVGGECAGKLALYRERVLRQLDIEDTLLRAQTEELLTEEEWSRVVSRISSHVHPGPNAR